MFYQIAFWKKKAYPHQASNLIGILNYIATPTMNKMIEHAEMVNYDGS
jgi:hypothetical protein